MGKPHNTKDFRIMRSVCIWLNNFKCELCRRKFNNLHVHHIDKNNKNNSLSNLMPLCDSCHKLTHKVNILRPYTYKHLVTLILKRMAQLPKEL